MNLDGAVIDSSVIGGTTPAAGTFTTLTASAASTITVSDNSDNLTLTSTDADAVSGPNVNFYRNSSSPADNDHLGEIRFTGRNDNSQDVVYANIETRIKDASDGTEDGYFDFETMVAGTLQSRLIMNETTTVFNEDSLDLDFRVESNGNANMLFVDAGNDRVGIGTGSPDRKVHINESTAATSNFIHMTTAATGETGSNGLLVGIGSAGNAEIWNYEAQPIIFATSSSERMRIDSSGNIGIGTTSPSGILHTSTSSDLVGRFESTDATAYVQINDTADSFYLATGSQIGSIGGNAGVNANNLNINLTNGNVGIGTSSPAYKLEVESSSDADLIQIQSTAGANNTVLRLGISGDVATLNASGDSSGALAIKTYGSERMRIDSSGNVGIGTTNPSYPFHVTGSGDTVAAVTAGASSIAALNLGNDTNKADGGIRYDNSADALIFRASNAEKMRVASAGDFMVAKTSLDVATVGHELRASGYSAATRDGSTVGSYTRLTSDGTILEFRKDGSAVGVIGSQYWGIGETSPQNLLHVKVSDTGIAPHASAQIVLERDGTNYLQFLTSATGTSGILFGDTNDVDVSKIYVDHNTTKMTFVNETSEAMVINGIHIGMGTSNPADYNAAADNLVVRSAGDTGITIAAGTSSDSTILFADGTGGTAGYRGRIGYDHAQDAMRFDTGATERMRLLNGGDLIIGGASFGADGALSISPDHDDNAAVILFDRGSTTATSDVIRFHNGGSAVGQIKYNSSTVSYDTSSDYRLKENVVEMSGALDRVNQLQPKRFNFISDADKTVDGFLAHEVQDIVPEAISGEKDGVDSEGNPDYQCIDHSKLVPLLTKAIQEQQAQIDALQSEINLLKGE
jgi:hypothetical protein